MTGTNLDQSTPSGQSDNPNPQLHDELMRELDARDELLEIEKSKAKRGEPVDMALEWLSAGAAIKFPDVWERYLLQAEGLWDLLHPKQENDYSTKRYHSMLQSFEAANLTTPSSSTLAEPATPNSNLDTPGLQQQTSQRQYPDNWSRWISHPPNNESYLRVVKMRGGLEHIRVYKLDNKIYGGDLRHDLGLCQAHFSPDQTCCLSWDQCPYRHWAIDALESRWVDPAWLETIDRMNRGPGFAPDHPFARYEGIPRQYVDGKIFKSSEDAYGEYSVPTNRSESIRTIQANT